jgi:hypothetical protein
MTDTQIETLFKEVMNKLEVIAHDVQQVKTSQRASQKRERKQITK